VDNQNLFEMSKLRYAVVNTRSNIVLSVHRNFAGASIVAEDLNKHLMFDDTVLFKVVELSGTIEYTLD